MTNEIWKEVPSRKGIRVSSIGRIVFPSRFANMPNGGRREYKPKPTYGYITKASKKARHEYMGIYNKHYGNVKVHRLVCEAFYGPPPFEKAVVIHKDEDATNNKIENIKWGTQKENLNAPGFIAYCKSRTGKDSPSYKGKLNRKAK